MNKKIYLLILLIFSLSGCLKQENLKYNQPIEYWETNINKNIAINKWDKSLEYFDSFEIEYPNNDKLKKLLLKIAEGFSDSSNLEKTEELYQRYLLKYATLEDNDYINYLIILNKYKYLDRPNHNYYLLNELIKECDKKIKEIQSNKFKEKIIKIKAKLILRKSEFDYEISKFYKNQNIKEGENLYKSKIIVKDWGKYKREEYQPEKKWYSFIVE